MCDLFSNSQNTQQNNQTSSNQSGQSTTQGNIWNSIQPFFQDFLQQYSPSNISSTGTPNSTQTTAASNQTGVADASTLAPGVSAASTVATNGLTPQSISSFMSPYISSVVDPTIAAQNQQNQQAISTLRGNQAARGALGNNTGSEAAYLAGVQPGQEATIANLYNQGYNTAANTALSSGQLQLSGANTLGSLSNAGTNANNALYNIGQGLFSTALTPYTLYNQGITGLGGLSGIAGSNTSSSGTATGTSTGNSTTTSNPSLGSILLGGLGTILSGMGKADGGSVGMKPFHAEDSDMMSKVAKNVRALHGLKKEMNGGSVKRYDDGGIVPYGDWNAPSPIGTETPAIGTWETTVTPASSFSAFSTANAGKSMMGFSDKLGAFGNDSKPQLMSDALPSQSAALASFMNGLSSANRPAYDDGGTVPSATPSDTSSSLPSFSIPSFDTIKSYLPNYSTGVWNGDAPTPMQRFGAALTQIGNGPFAGFGKAIMDQQGMRYKDLEAQREAERLGIASKELAMQQELQPSRVSEAASNATIAAHNADMGYALRLKRAEALLANEMAIDKAQRMNEFAKTLPQSQIDNTSKMMGAPISVTTQDQYDSLPSGTPYIDPTGTTRRKP